MTPADFLLLQTFLKSRSGLDLAADKQYLVDSRLNPVAVRNGHGDAAAMVAALRTGRDKALEKVVVEAMTTNESFFFRDKTPFDEFRERIVPTLMERRGQERRLRIWCAAASTGQEPYSLAMILKDMGPQMANWRSEIVGTDLSQDVIEKARAGLYSQFEVQRGLPAQMLIRYFAQQGEMWQLNAAIRAMVDYRVFNLLDPFTMLGRFDVIYCRNVLIYFDAQTKRDVLDRLAQQLAPDGYLVLGAAETVVGLTDSFTRVEGARGIYRPVSEADTARPAAAALVRGGGAAAAQAREPAAGKTVTAKVLPLRG